MSLVSSQDIDWEGRCVFEGGKVASFKVPSQSNHLRMIPIPVDDETLREARQASAVLDGIMKPATADQIAIAVKKLSLHCGMQAKAPQDVKFLFMDYCSDLAKYPIKLIEDACRDYRTLPEGNNFMPSSGKLINLIEPNFRKLIRLKDRIDKILGIYAEAPKRENKQVSLTEALNQFLA